MSSVCVEKYKYLCDDNYNCLSDFPAKNPICLSIRRRRHVSAAAVCTSFTWLFSLSSCYSYYSCIRDTQEERCDKEHNFYLTTSCKRPTNGFVTPQENWHLHNLKTCFTECLARRESHSCIDPATEDTYCAYIHRLKLPPLEKRSDL